MNPILITLLINTAYAVCGGIAVIYMMRYGYQVIDQATPFDTNKQLKDGNIAVGLMVLGTFLGIGIAMGLVIGLSLM